MLHLLRSTLSFAMAGVVWPMDRPRLGLAYTNLARVLSGVADKPPDVMSFRGVANEEPELQLRIFLELVNNVTGKRSIFVVKIMLLRTETNRPTLGLGQRWVWRPSLR